MSRRPTARTVRCPSCGNTVYAVVPGSSEVVETDEDADGKVWTRCRDCGERFLVYYRSGE